MEGVKREKSNFQGDKVVPDTLECDDSGYPALKGSPLALCQIPGRLDVSDVLRGWRVLQLLRGGNTLEKARTVNSQEYNKNASQPGFLVIQVNGYNN